MRRFSCRMRGGHAEQPGRAPESDSCRSCCCRTSCTVVVFSSSPAAFVTSLRVCTSVVAMAPSSRGEARVQDGQGAGEAQPPACGGHHAARRLRREQASIKMAHGGAVARRPLTRHRYAVHAQGGAACDMCAASSHQRRRSGSSAARSATMKRPPRRCWAPPPPTHDADDDVPSNFVCSAARSRSRSQPQRQNAAACSRRHRREGAAMCARCCSRVRKGMR
jgi:hypothetical protein